MKANDRDETDPPRAPAARWLAGLEPARLADLGREFAEAVLADGLTVFRPEEGGFRPIPVVFSPEVVTPVAMATLSQDARRLLAATVKLAAATLGPGRQALADTLYGAFTPWEREVTRDAARLANVATARVDYFSLADGAARALEVNATIPAMHGYSDIVLHRWIRLVAREQGLSPERADELVRRAGSNVDDLLTSLLAHYERQGGRGVTPSILAVSRRGDSQLGELAYVARRFATLGHRARHAFVDELQLDDAGRVHVDGEPYDIVYRHIFARRLEPDWPLARLLSTPRPGGTIVFNPVVSPLEVKAMLALLHEAVADPARARANGLDPDVLGLDPDEHETVARTVPWTRLLHEGPATLSDGTRVADLAAWAAANGDHLVLKRSWDYGGKSVHIGTDAPDWPGIIGGAVREPGGCWVLQELVPPRAVSHLLLVPDAASGGVSPSWRELWVDVSAYTSHGAGPAPRGGVCRASASKVVNLLGGGGLTPLCSSDIEAALFGT